MPHYVQAKRDVGGHVADRDEVIPEGHVIEANSRDHARHLVNTNHFIYRGKHEQHPPSLTKPLEAPDPTVFSDAEVGVDDDDEDENDEGVESELEVDEGDEGQTTPGQPEHPMGDEVDDQQFGDSGQSPADNLQDVDGIGPKRSQELTEEHGIETVGQLAESSDAPEHLVEAAREHIQS